jgi:hypothetical protein
MDPYLIAQIKNSASLPWVFAAIGFHVINVFLGAYMGFNGKIEKYRRLHRLLFYVVLFCLVYFLILNYFHGANWIWEYLIVGYFIIIIPLSKRWDMLVHGLVTVVGLTLLPVLVILQIN